MLRKSQERPQSSPQGLPVASINSALEENTVATVLPAEPLGKICVSNNQLEVSNINNVPCKVTALLDSGSPVSFINYSIFKKFFKPDTKLSLAKNYKSLSQNDLPTLGSILTAIKLKLLPNLCGPINSIVFKQDYTADIIIGLDFLNNDIAITLRKDNQNNEECIKLFSEIAFAQEDDNSSVTCATVVTDFGPKIDQQVTSVLSEIDNTQVKPIEDNYSVKISLKDDSVYRYAP